MTDYILDAIIARKTGEIIAPEDIAKVAGREPHRIKAELRRFGHPNPSRAEALVALVKWQPSVMDYILQKMDAMEEQLALRDEEIKFILLGKGYAAHGVPASAARPRISLEEMIARIGFGDTFTMRQVFDALSPDDKARIGWDDTLTMYADELAYIEHKLETGV